MKDSAKCRHFVPWFVLALVLTILLGFEGAAQGAKGGNKPPKDEPPPDPAIVYGGNDIIVVNADGSNSRKIVADGCRNKQPSWSPDGTELVFHSDCGSGDFGIFIVGIGPDDGPPEKVADTTALFITANPAWHPSAGLIAYSDEPTDPSSPHNDIYLVDLATKIPKNLTNNSIVNQGNPVWSPSGDRIAFIEVNELPPMDGSVLLMYSIAVCDFDYVARLIENCTQISLPDTFFPNTSIHGLTWAKVDENLLAFNASGDRTDLWCTDLNTGETTIIPNTVNGQSPSFSPDDIQIVYRIKDTKLSIATADLVYGDPDPTTGFKGCPTEVTNIQDIVGPRRSSRNIIYPDWRRPIPQE